MSSNDIDWDEIVHTDPDGLVYTRREFPAIDYPAGTEVCLAGFPEARGVVIDPKDIEAHAPEQGGPMEHVPVRWSWSHQLPEWRHTDGIRRVDGGTD